MRLCSLLLLVISVLVAACASKEPRLLLDLGGFDQGADSRIIVDSGVVDAPQPFDAASDVAADLEADAPPPDDATSDQDLEGAE